jgi:hypothetical protein
MVMPARALQSGALVGLSKHHGVGIRGLVLGPLLLGMTEIVFKTDGPDHLRH